MVNNNFLFYFLSCALIFGIIMAKNCPAENNCKFKIILECSSNVVVESIEATTPQKICCPPLSQTISKSTQFADGIMTFTYDNINCPTTVLINCSAPDPTLQLNSAIVANSIDFLSVGSSSTTFPGTCNDQGKWTVGNPPIIVDDLECFTIPV